MRRRRRVLSGSRSTLRENLLLGSSVGSDQAHRRCALRLASLVIALLERKLRC